MAIDRPEPETRSHRAAHESVALSPELTKEIKALCRREGATLFMALLAAFKVLLYRYSGQEDLIVGTATANRNLFELEKLIGFFVNTLPLRTDLSGDPTFRELLARVREAALGAYAHQETPFEKLVSELQPERSLNRTPLFRVFFALQNTPISVVHLPELTLAPVEMGAGLTKMDLVLTMRDSASGLTGTIEYDTDLFDRATIKKAPVHFRTLLENIVEAPDRPLSSLRLLSEIENEDQRRLALPEFQIGRQDLENILIQINSIPAMETK
jgi:non-ribosomal peptide synthetase component F